jgi:phosphatidylserine/phosphatidylglycerophosphate/cardiolipin synthase-like enzyme
MRSPTVGSKVRVRAIAGTYTVLLAMDVELEARSGLLGFAIQREDVTESESYWLSGLKVFPSVVPNPQPGVSYLTLQEPIQSLLWGDYTAKPAHEYRYTVRPLYNKPKALKPGADVTVSITTERESGPGHSVWFNRGAIASQAFAAKFKNAPPPHPEDPTATETRWLSRGLLEACLAFIAEANAGDALRVAAYEFSYPPILGALDRARKKGVDVKIVYEAGSDTVKGKKVATEATVGNRKAIARAKLPQSMLIKRTRRAGIPHNKFIVRLRNGTTPVSVWTGSTNFSESGFLGQTNVGHRVDDPGVAATFLAYWQALASDPEPQTLKPETAQITPDPPSPPGAGTTCLFSPRKGTTMLDWYAAQITGATSAVMLTGAFGVTDVLATAIGKHMQSVDFLLLEKPPTKKAAGLLGKGSDLIVAYGNVLGQAYQKNAKGELTLRRKVPGSELEKWFLEEEHFRKTGYVFFVHTKFLLVDPLSSDPRIFAGSANFSPDSLTSNDENMLLIRGDTRVADIYMTEFDRILRHFYFRDVAGETAGDGKQAKSKFLAEDASWLEPYYRAGSFKDRRRRLFFP